MTTNHDPSLRRIDLELAREPGHPEGSTGERYVIVAPLDDEDRLDGERWREVREHCSVYRERGGVAVHGHLLHGPGGRWILRYDDDGADETGFRFETEQFRPGEYISIQGGGQSHVYRITGARPV